MTEGRAPDRPAGKWLGPDGPGARLLSVIVAIMLLALASVVVFFLTWIPGHRADAVRRWQQRLDVVAEDREIAVAN